MDPGRHPPDPGRQSRRCVADGVNMAIAGRAAAGARLAAACARPRAAQRRRGPRRLFAATLFRVYAAASRLHSRGRVGGEAASAPSGLPFARACPSPDRD